MRKIEHREGYKHTPLGVIPNEWEWTTIGKISKVGSGSTPRKDEKAYWLNGHIPWIPTGEVNERILTNSKSFITEFALQDLSIALLPVDTVLLAMIGQGKTRGKAALLKSQAWVNQNFAYIIPKQEVSASFLFYQLENNYGRIRYEGNRGGSQGSLNTEIVRNLLTLIPPPAEQIRIATILELWDSSITKTCQMIAQLNERNRGLLQQLLSGKKRLKGYERKPWPKVHANELFKTVSIKNNGALPLLSATQDNGIVPRNKLEGRVTMPTGDTDSFKLVERGDFVISLRSFQGGIEYSEYTGLVSPAYTVLKPVLPISDQFYRFYFKSYEFIGHLAVAVIGIRDGKQISYEDFSFLKLPYPTIEEQQEIAALLSEAENEIIKWENKLQELQIQKKALMQKLLTGEIRIAV